MTDEQMDVQVDRASWSARFYTRLHRYKHLLRKRWWLLLLVVAVAVGARWLQIWRAPMSFISVGQMIVSVKLAIPEGSMYTEELSNFLGTQVALMQSGAVQNRAFARLQSLQPNLAPMPVELKVTVTPKTTIFVLRATGSHPDYTRSFLQGCMEEYISLKKEMREQTSENTLVGITAELAKLERELKKGEEDLVAFQTANSIVFLQEQGNSAGTYLVALNRQLADLKTEFQLLTLLSFDQNLERQQKKTPAGTIATGDGDSPADLLTSGSEYLRARQQIQLMKAEQQELSEFLRPKHPKIIKLNEEIAQRERLLKIFREQGLEQLENRRSSLALQIQNLESEVKEWETKSLEVSKKMAEYQKIRSNNQRIQSLYDRLLATTQTLGVNKEISPESVTIMEPASPPMPNRPDLARALGIAGAVGLAIAVAMFMLLNRLDDRMSSFTELQDHFDEPVLGQIPKERTILKGRQSGLLQPDDERHTFLEAYRNLRSSLLYMSMSGKRPRLLLVTSSVPDDGKSLTTANLAITLAQGGARVVLIDADLRRGILHRQFDVGVQPGFLEVLTEKESWRKAVQPTKHENLFLLPRGGTSNKSGELFLNPATAQVLRELGQEYEFVIVDSPPVMAADDVASLAPHVEGVLFVIRAQHTSARVARAALELLYQRNVQVLGLVFNAVEPNAAEYYYYKYKDYYTAYPTT